LYIAKGKKVIHEKLSNRGPDEPIGTMLLGPSGYLRAPACRKGGILMVGFDEETYRKLFL
jgi:hypothetical protein